jgi:hypothetical protein
MSIWKITGCSLLLAAMLASCSDGKGTEGDADTDGQDGIGDAADRLDATSCDGVTCSGHGHCEMQPDGPVCICDPGYAGFDCGECAPGYAFDPYGECRPTCATDCGPHGTCVIVDGVDTCVCDPGFEGPRCENFSGSRLEIYALDIWGGSLEPWGPALTIQHNGNPVTPTFPVTTVETGEAGTMTIHLETAGFLPMDVTLGYDGTNSAAAFAVTDFPNEAGHGLSLSRDQVDGTWTHVLYLGQRHEWFSAVGSPARRGNNLRFLMDGEEAWQAVGAELQSAYSSVILGTWWWESDFELFRGDSVEDIYYTSEQRQANTVMAILDSLPSVYKRVIVNQFVSQDGILEDFNVDDALLAKGSGTGDNFEYMGQVNPTAGVFDFQMEMFQFRDRVQARWPEAAAATFDDELSIVSPVPGHAVDITLPLGVEGISVASYHQKFTVIDGTTAFVGGMNVKATDWDTNGHIVYDPRRMVFEATTSEREEVLAREADPDTGPRKDLMMFIDGPIVEDVAEVFKVRWDYLIGEGVRFAENASTFDIVTDLPGYADGVDAQLTVTMPQPFWRHSIAETWFQAIRNARSYIYIEDQYFRAPMLNDLILQRLTEEPGLVLIVVTKPVSEWTDPGCWWTHITDTLFEEAFPGRYLPYQLRSFDYVDVGWGWDETESRFVDMDTHTKVLIVDDVFLSVGSCNHNNRGLVYEGEMNVAVHDYGFVREARRRLFSNILSVYYTDSEDAAVMADDFQQAAAWNQSVWGNWEAEAWDISLDGAPLPDEYNPRGFLYPLEFRQPEDCLLENISEDLTVM